MSNVFLVDCTGVCPGYENNNRCDVPQLCAKGTDCVDCTQQETLWQILGILVCAFLWIVGLFACFLFRKQQKLNRLLDA